MDKFNSYKSIPQKYTGSVVAIGNFDGVHLGHQKVFEVTKHIALEKKVPSSILTFEPHPRQYFSPESPSFRLISSETRTKLINDSDFDALFELPFDTNLASLSSSDFIQRVLYEGLRISHVVVGEDFRFGKGREGNTDQLTKMGESLDFKVTALPKLTESDLTYSSSAVRNALKEGNLEITRACLGRWHSVTGIVKEGSKVGRSIGFPTANMEFSGVVIPKYGIYSVFIEILTGKYKGNYQGASSIGIKPTFGNHNPNLETYIFDFDGDIYGEKISVSLVKFLRPEIKFDSIDNLIVQIKSDCRVSREYLAEIS